MAKLISGTRVYGTATVDTQLFVSGNNAASSTQTGALQIIGGVGIGGSLFVAGGFTVGGSITFDQRIYCNADQAIRILAILSEGN